MLTIEKNLQKVSNRRPRNRHSGGWASHAGSTGNSGINQSRWYDPSVGRWLSEDPISFAGGDANLYRYCGNGPTNGTDPSGEVIFALFGHSWQKFSATVTDSTGKTQNFTTPSDLLNALTAIDTAGNKITSMWVRGHGSSKGIENDTGAGPARAFSVDGFSTIYVNGQDVTGMMMRITDQNTRIDLRGCFTTKLAKKTAKALGNGATVTGTVGLASQFPHWLFGAHCARLFWSNYSYPPGSEESSHLDEDSSGNDIGP